MRGHAAFQLGLCTRGHEICTGYSPWDGSSNSQLPGYQQVWPDPGSSVLNTYSPQKGIDTWQGPSLESKARYTGQYSAQGLCTERFGFIRRIEPGRPLGHKQTAYLGHSADSHFGLGEVAVAFAAFEG